MNGKVGWKPDISWRVNVPQVITSNLPVEVAGIVIIIIIIIN